MTGRRISNILLKEWEIIFHDLNNTLFVTLVPLLIVAEPLVFMWLAAHFGGESMSPLSDIRLYLVRLKYLGGGTAPTQQFQVFF
jgi:hypothetical protein